MRLFAMETATVFQTATSSHTPTFAPFQAPYLLSFFFDPFACCLLGAACAAEAMLRLTRYIMMTRSPSYFWRVSVAPVASRGARAVAVAVVGAVALDDAAAA